MMKGMMKKNMKWIWPAVFMCGVWSACDERTPDLYSAPDGIYFNNRTAGVAVDTTTVSFVYEADDVDYMDVPVTVQTIGRQTDFHRPVNIRVWSENAVEGEDYELVTPAVVPARTSSFPYVVRLKRTPEIKTELKSVYLELSANDYFEVFLPQEETGSEQRPVTELLTFRIDFSDYYSTSPAGWRKEYVGEFSERKLRLMWKLFDDVVAREDYNTPGAIPFNRWVYMQRELDVYMDEQYAILRGWEIGEVDVDALVDPTAEGDNRQLLDFTPVTSEN